ncbi:hypothetical protein BK120_14900 [Paenibacillus sp. FSL A5-0031]|uniref:hypothetical protein n=1 Tax=Paenibacillus sp. FSL A5-0031 TaxID=1920420 RepID=UPI00096CCD32|nr:hypothetical protein [Paenibacillus sp. FSL A5-0031]OME83088.1 hypothetical protein BK120_14900 [Paenibacillus sp. FSL A5-0031]
MHKDRRLTVESFLRRMKILVSTGHKRLVYRKDINVKKGLLVLGFINSNEIWTSVLELKTSDSIKDPEFDRDGSGELVYFFKRKMPNASVAYIKLKIKATHQGEMCVCLSFHPDT